MAYEIDMIPVGDGERSGDAICLRYSVEGNWKIHVVDGGTVKSGEELVQHINGYYSKPKSLDAVVLTHADDDHSSGLRSVLASFEVRGLWMNRPWLYAQQVVDDFKDPRWTVDGLRKALRDAFPILVELEKIAEQKKIPIYEAFQGTAVGQFTILSPSKQRYIKTICQLSRTPAPTEKKAEQTLYSIVAEAMRKAGDWIKETWGKETLEDSPTTSDSNETSVVQFATLDGNKILLTGDAGVISLKEASDYAVATGVGLPGLRFMQVPHHGSRHNVSPSVLNTWVGPILPQGQTVDCTAFASVAKKDEGRPRKKVINAYLRRGAKIYSTDGQVIHHFNGASNRGWTPLTPHEFSEDVEA